jgi:hypothetical protein
MKQSTFERMLGAVLLILGVMMIAATCGGCTGDQAVPGAGIDFTYVKDPKTGVQTIRYTSHKDIAIGSAVLNASEGSATITNVSSNGSNLGAQQLQFQQAQLYYWNNTANNLMALVNSLAPILSKSGLQIQYANGVPTAVIPIPVPTATQPAR